MSKQEMVINELKNKPMTVHELSEKFWPDITYSYIKTMVHRMCKQGILKISDVEKLKLYQGGSREVYRYAILNAPLEDARLADEDLLPIRRRVANKGKDAKPNLTHTKLGVELRKELVVKQNPLFAMYFGDKYL